MGGQTAKRANYGSGSDIDKPSPMPDNKTEGKFGESQMNARKSNHRRFCMALTVPVVLVTASFVMHAICPRNASAADVLAQNWKTDGSVATCENRYPAGATVTIYVDRFHGKSIELGGVFRVNGQAFTVKKAGDVLRASTDANGRIVIDGPGNAASGLGEVTFTRTNILKETEIYSTIRVVVSL